MKYVIFIEIKIYLINLFIYGYFVFVNYYFIDLNIFLISQIYQFFGFTISISKNIFLS